jgi:hypothetical protein
MFKASASTSYANQIITFFFKGQSDALGCTHPTFLQLLCYSYPKASECNIHLEDLFCDYYGKEGYQDCLFCQVPRTKATLNTTGKIYMHLLLPFNQKARHISLPLKLSPPKVIPMRMLRKRSTMLTRRRCFKPMPLKFKLYKMNSNH